MAAVASPWLVAADSLFVSGLTPPCRCIGTCSVVSHAGLTGRGLAAALAPALASAALASAALAAAVCALYVAHVCVLVC